MPKRKRTNFKWRTPSDGIKAAIAAYRNGEKVVSICERFDVGMSSLYDCLRRLEIQKRKPGCRPDPSAKVRAAIAAYKDGDEVRDIIERFSVSWATLYYWLEFEGVPLRRVRMSKAGRPLESPFPTECDWCGDPLSEYQIKRRRKYCCRKCQDAGINAQRVVRLCPAEGCGAPIRDSEMSFCGWGCFKKAMEARFG